MNSLTSVEREKLLGDRRVVEEIQRHLWFESEKAGYDIGFERAKDDWLQKFSKAWMTYHMSDELIKSRKSAAKASAKISAPKKRRAKSYLK